MKRKKYQNVKKSIYQAILQNFLWRIRQIDLGREKLFKVKLFPKIPEIYYFNSIMWYFNF